MSADYGRKDENLNPFLPVMQPDTGMLRGDYIMAAWAQTADSGRPFVIYRTLFHSISMDTASLSMATGRVAESTMRAWRPGMVLQGNRTNAVAVIGGPAGHRFCGSGLARDGDARTAAIAAKAAPTGMRVEISRLFAVPAVSPWFKNEGLMS